MCILMLFNETDVMTYNEILQATLIPAPELKRALQSMACVKVRASALQRRNLTAC